MKKLILVSGLFLAFLFSIFPVFSQEKDTCSFDSNLVISQNSEYFKPFCEAVSHYPELSGVPIRLKFKRIKTTMASLPKFCSVFRSPHKRRYVIVVDTFFHKKPKVYFDSLTYNSRVGIAGHELAHLASYQKLSSVKFIGFLFSYAFSSKYRTKIEKRTDELTIEHNLGEELYELSYYIFNKAVTSEKYKRYKSKHYYNPSDIRALVDKYNKLKAEKN